MAYRVYRMRLASGEHMRVLDDQETGLSLWYPNLYCTTQLRNAGRSPLSIESTLRDILIVLEYTGRRGIDLEERIRRRAFLSVSEIDGLCDDAMRRRRSPNAPKRGVTEITARIHQENTEGVNSDHYYRRLSHIASYLQWLSHHILGIYGTKDDANAIFAFVDAIRARRPLQRNTALDEAKSLTEEAFERLLDVIRPEAPGNPFREPAAARRNAVIMHMLGELGMRAGELLGIQIGDIDFQSLTVTIHRRPDDTVDPRHIRPRTKTLPRELPATRWLINTIYQYVINDRYSSKGARRHGFLLVTHKRGPGEGAPLSLAALNKVCTTLSRTDTRLAVLHPHVLRHTWNDRYSRMQDSLPARERPSEAEQSDRRAYIMGWVPGGKAVRFYNKRFVKEKADKELLRMQEENETRLTSND